MTKRKTALVVLALIVGSTVALAMPATASFWGEVCLAELFVCQWGCDTSWDNCQLEAAQDGTITPQEEMACLSEFRGCYRACFQSACSG